jgi:hypothetical protein
MPALLALAALVGGFFYASAAAALPPAMRPPARFDYVNREARVLYVSERRAAELCGPKHWSNPGGTACAIGVRPCLIVISVENPLPGVLRHEHAHCNGWGADHEL